MFFNKRILRFQNQTVSNSRRCCNWVSLKPWSYKLLSWYLLQCELIPQRFMQVATSTPLSQLRIWQENRGFFVPSAVHYYIKCGLVLTVHLNTQGSTKKRNVISPILETVDWGMSTLSNFFRITQEICPGTGQNSDFCSILLTTILRGNRRAIKTAGSETPIPRSDKRHNSSCRPTQFVKEYVTLAGL